MEITITARELLDRGLWGDYCRLSGTNEWAVNEGLMDSSDKVTISEDHAHQLGLLSKYG